MKEGITGFPMKRYKGIIVKQTIFALLGISLVYFLIGVTGFSFKDLFEKCLSIELNYILLMLGLTFLTILLKSSRWSLIVRLLTNKEKFPNGFFFHYTCLSTLIAFFVSQTFSHLGVKTLSLKYKQDIRVIEGSSTVVIEHILNFLIMLASALPSFLFVSKLLPGVLAISVSFTLIIAIFIVTNNYYHLMLKYAYATIAVVYTIVGKIPLLRKIAHFELTFNAPASEIKKINALKLLFFSVIIYYALLIRYYIYAGALNIEIPLLQFILTFPIVYIISIIGITPGAIGIAEFGWFGVLLYIGVSKEEASLFVISQRIFSVFSMLIIGLFGYIYYLFSSAPLAKNVSVLEENLNSCS
ncbi:MAG: UPF0104 family protein [Candidatus Scalindua sp. AMX11]|nr:MAG: UPF0104 family protein [Candidatus Scalindua sp.]NOG82247.1 flippase-like domain-containing protein [Planctomycetota bacterium]RZV71461.1 MAG: flippase-like domain-containing protein [Candidatus Scalindua sp. SCAELEC01]TDE64275.1 MAG: UPF0104 family protein [Candidatus Scalindua sp. AMX11]GJQ59913.1 MAG: hypothetical protein SCALA701_27140 [Candidatus Scalindua sp.]